MTNYKKTKIKYGTFYFLHQLLPIFTLLTFILIAFITGETREKVVISVVSIIEIAFLAFAAIFKYKLSSTIWIAVLTVYLGLKDWFITPLLIVTIYTVLDDLCFSFFYKKYQKLYRDLKALKLHDEDKANE